mgnify:CR=1 FL=1
MEAEQRTDSRPAAFCKIHVVTLRGVHGICSAAAAVPALRTNLSELEHLRYEMALVKGSGRKTMKAGSAEPMPAGHGH